MAERMRSASYSYYGESKLSSGDDFSPKKTILVLVVVVGCFAVLWPKLFYPMLVANVNNQIKPGPIDKTTRCCDVIYDTDLNTIRIMSELCKSIINAKAEPPTSQAIVRQCRKAVLESCGIDISAVLQEKVGLGHSVKQILEEVRSLNGSLCLKHHFGVSPWRLGVPHRVTLSMGSSSIRQERPQHLRPEMIHPAFRERGRAIPQSEAGANWRTNPSPRIVEGRPGPIPGMRPTIGGAGHVVPSKQQNNGVMGLLMPIYTIGFIIFFTYTIMKLVFKKKADAYQEETYPSCETNEEFRKQVFESAQNYYNQRPHTNNSKIGWKERDAIVNAVSAILEEVDQEIQARKNKSRETLSEQNEDKSDSSLVATPNEEGPSVTIMGMETTASCEGGKKWQCPTSTIPKRQVPIQEEAEPLPQQIFLEAALPPQSQILVADSATETENNTDENAAVILAGKMTLSVISFDSENSIEESPSAKKEYFEEERRTSSSNTSDEFENMDASQLEDQIDNIIEEARAIAAVETFDESDELDKINEEMKENLDKAADTEQQDVIEGIRTTGAFELFDPSVELNKLNKEIKQNVDKIEDKSQQDKIIEEIWVTSTAEKFEANDEIDNIIEKVKQNLNKLEDQKQQEVIQEIQATQMVQKLESKEFDKINEELKQDLNKLNDIKQDIIDEIHANEVVKTFDPYMELDKVNEEVMKNIDRMARVKQDVIKEIRSTDEAVEKFDASEELEKINEGIKQHLDKANNAKQQDVMKEIKGQLNLKDDLLGTLGAQEFTSLEDKSYGDAKKIEELSSICGEHVCTGGDSQNVLKDISSDDQQLRERAAALVQKERDLNKGEHYCENVNQKSELSTKNEDLTNSISLRELEWINKELEFLSEHLVEQENSRDIQPHKIAGDEKNVFGNSNDQKPIKQLNYIHIQSQQNIENNKIDADQSRRAETHLTERQSNDEGVTGKSIQEQIASTDENKPDCELLNPKVVEIQDDTGNAQDLFETLVPYREEFDVNYDSDIENVVDDVEYVDESDEQELEDEIRNLEGSEAHLDRITNGNLSESSTKVVEVNEISDSTSESEQADEDDEEIEEIIEYVDNTDEEGEEIIEISNNGMRHNRENETN
ncbi:interaptin isoform X2 [Cylas formicarius]|uniref:interaptin isoform X2 n=1 Tax=Cylas formicarius TaxID=197179 RepID=UPI002958BC77|nr:interaptin isoform X2 [Cylas formicarius]